MKYLRWLKTEWIHNKSDFGLDTSIDSLYTSWSRNSKRRNNPKRCLRYDRVSARASHNRSFTSKLCG